MGQRVHLLRFCKILESIIVNEELLGTWSEKKRDYVGKFPKRGEGSDPNPLHIFSVFFPFQGLIKWQKNGKKM